MLFLVLVERCGDGFEVMTVSGVTSCIKVHAERKNWVDAQQACQRDRANLISIHDDEVTLALAKH